MLPSACWAPWPGGTSLFWCVDEVSAGTTSCVAAQDMGAFHLRRQAVGRLASDIAILPLGKQGEPHRITPCGALSV